ncbi:ATP-binding protein [Streptomyces sp. NPDC087901]|uniref:ATP-binding protein n=1 Tax=unclassified Streptomyces TaxID=2593676 RepID=UPI003422CB35
MPPTTAEPVHDRSLGDLPIHRDVVLDGLDAPQHAARTVLADILDGKAEDQLFGAMLVASELIANAIQHSSGAVLIRVEAYEFGVALGVVDRGPTSLPYLPDLRTYLLTKGPVAASGRGLFTVDSLASAWSVEETENGKIVIAIHPSGRPSSMTPLDLTRRHLGRRLFAHPLGATAEPSGCHRALSQRRTTGASSMACAAPSSSVPTSWTPQSPTVPASPGMSESSVEGLLSR